MNSKTEQQIQQEIMLHLSSAYNGFVIHWRSNVGTVKKSTGGFFRTGLVKGHSDIAGLLMGGRALYIEVKTAKGKLSPEQKNFLAITSQMGALSFVARSVDDVDAHLQAEFARHQSDLLPQSKSKKK